MLVCQLLVATYFLFLIIRKTSLFLLVVVSTSLLLLLVMAGCPVVTASPGGASAAAEAKAKGISWRPTITIHGTHCWTCMNHTWTYMNPLLNLYEPMMCDYNPFFNESWIVDLHLEMRDPQSKSTFMGTRPSVVEGNELNPSQKPWVGGEWIRFRVSIAARDLK